MRRLGSLSVDQDAIPYDVCLSREDAPRATIRKLSLHVKYNLERLYPRCSATLRQLEVHPETDEVGEDGIAVWAEAFDRYAGVIPNLRGRSSEGMGVSWRRTIVRLVSSRVSLFPVLEVNQLMTFVDSSITRLTVLLPTTHMHIRDVYHLTANIPLAFARTSGLEVRHLLTSVYHMHRPDKFQDQDASEIWLP